MKTALAGCVVLPDRLLPKGIVLIDGNKISDVIPATKNIREKPVRLVDFGENYVSPGLINIHLHGALGKDVMDAEAGSLEVIASHEAKHGVTGFLAGTTSSSLEETVNAIKAVQEASHLSLDSQVLGVHIEGPFLNPQKKGAHDPGYIREMSREEVNILMDALGDLKGLISLAPEVGDNMSYIQRLKKKGVAVSIAHSLATYEQAMESFREGITHATHLFNAMREFHPREPGVVGAVLDSPEVTAELIADGVHLHPASIRLAVRAKGADRICLVTDSVKAAGSGDGVYKMGNLEIEVKGAEARLRKSGVLAGSVLTLNQAVKNVVRWTGLEVWEAINMASLVPARILGLDGEMGSLQRKKWANIAVFDKDFNVKEVYLKGQRVCKPA